MNRFGPKNANEAEIFAIENFRADLQQVIHAVMEETGINYGELAKRLKCSAANISQMLSDDSNPTVESIARIFFALGAEPKISTDIYDVLVEKSKAYASDMMIAIEARPMAKNFAMWWESFGVEESKEQRTQEWKRGRKEIGPRENEAVQSVALVMRALEGGYWKAHKLNSVTNGNGSSNIESRNYRVA